MQFALALLLLSRIPDPSTAELMGQFDPARHPDFVRVDSRYTSKEGLYLRKEALDAFRRMHEAASVAGVPLSIVSATRTFEHQKSIWERKWAAELYAGWDPESKARHIMRFSAMPGTSRHHWGTDVDLNSLENAYFGSGEGKRVYDWLCENAASFGFYQVYGSKEEGRPGYEEEKWHWSYAPLSAQLFDRYVQTIDYPDISGFDGAEVAATIAVIRYYVEGVRTPPGEAN